jgi:hypothetical protein
MLGILTPFQKLLQTPPIDVDIKLKPSTTTTSFEPLEENFNEINLNLNSSKRSKFIF